MKKKANKRRIEAAAAAIGLITGPVPEYFRWNDFYKPKVRWPNDYTPIERKVLRKAARAALAAR